MKPNLWKILTVVIVVLAVVAAVALKDNGREAKPELADSSARSGKLPKMLELGAEKCTPCKMMKNVMAELEKEYAETLAVEFVDVWKNPSVAREYKIKTIPTQVFFDAGGKEIARHTGYFSKDEIVATFRDHGIDLKRSGKAD